MAMAADLERALPPTLAPSAWSDSPYHKMVTNVVLVLGAFVPVLLDLLPMIFLSITRSVERTVQLFRAPVMVVSVVHAAIWLLFTLVEDETTASNEEKSTELVISYPMMLVANYLYLLVMCFHYNRPFRGMLLSTFVLPFTAYIFYACRFGTSLVEKYENFIGGGGVLALILFHSLTISDIEKINGFFDYLLMVLNIIPTGLLSGATYIVLSKRTHPPLFVLLSSEVGSVCFLLEVCVMIMHSRNHNHGGGGHNHGHNDDNHDQGGGGNQEHGNNGNNHNQGGGGDQNQGNNGDNNHQGGGGDEIQNHNNNGEDNAHAVAAEGGQHAQGHQGQHFGQAQNQHEVEVVIQHDVAANLAGLNDRIGAAEHGASDVSTELNFDVGETETSARDFRKVVIQHDVADNLAGLNDRIGGVTDAEGGVLVASTRPRPQGVPVASTPRGLSCCGIPRQRRRPVPQPVA